MSKKNEAASGERTIIGKVVGVHGVNGTMLILPLTDYPERFFAMKELVLDKPGKPRRTLKVKKIAPYEGKGTLFLQAEGVTDRDQAEAVKGSVITVADEERVELSQDEYWIDDIVGMSVTEEATGKLLGTVEEIIFTGSNDVYLVRTGDGKLLPIPATGDAVRGVDVKNGTMTVVIPEGLWD